MMRENVDLRELSSFKIGGRAKWFWQVTKVEQLQSALDLARKKKIKPLVVGGMTNVLWPDTDLELVIQLVAG
ncbi:MAG: hypothetical protein LBD63_03665, partial [Mycoplasmataceae bacterium]|nr:hypothetical protein [Mycoplasmataceae bacterium]